MEFEYTGEAESHLSVSCKPFSQKTKSGSSMIAGTDVCLRHKHDELLISIADELRIHIQALLPCLLHNAAT